MTGNDLRSAALALLVVSIVLNVAAFGLTYEVLVLRISYVLLAMSFLAYQIGIRR